MLASKLYVHGPIARIEPDRIIIHRGDVTDIYNTRYYRVLPEVEVEHEQRESRPIQRATNPTDEAGT
jgi:hypothetical protein